MKIEIVEFYREIPYKTNQKSRKILGTMHIYLIDYKIDLRGIVVSRIKNFYFFRLPHGKQRDIETGKLTSYPILSFSEEGLYQSILDFLHTQGIKYIEEQEKSLINN